MDHASDHYNLAPPMTHIGAGAVHIDMTIMTEKYFLGSRGNIYIHNVWSFPQTFTEE